MLGMRACHRLETTAPQACSVMADRLSALLREQHERKCCLAQQEHTRGLKAYAGGLLLWLKEVCAGRWFTQNKQSDRVQRAQAGYCQADFIHGRGRHDKL